MAGLTADVGLRSAEGRRAPAPGRLGEPRALRCPGSQRRDAPRARPAPAVSPGFSLAVVAQHHGAQLAVGGNCTKHILVLLARFAAEDLEQALEERRVRHHGDLLLGAGGQPPEELHGAADRVLLGLALVGPGLVLVRPGHEFVRVQRRLLTLPVPVLVPGVAAGLRHGHPLVAEKLSVPLAAEVVHQEGVEVGAILGAAGAEDDVGCLHTAAEGGGDDEIDVELLHRMQNRVPVDLAPQRVALVPTGLRELGVLELYSFGRGPMHRLVLQSPESIRLRLVCEHVGLFRADALCERLIQGVDPGLLHSRLHLGGGGGLVGDDVVEALGMPHEVHACAARAQEDGEPQPGLLVRLRKGNLHRTLKLNLVG
mmetsp:Transcript_34894/g.92418  ORF Transcript_34894/g.92418 Transcript_34894/m.92418 type:complete len:369 (-) Transcript_34894:353-1459(-)